MAGQTGAESQGQRRRFARVPLAGSVHYICAPNDGGVGIWQDVGQGGACVKLNRYLRPGTLVLLSVKLGFESGAYSELKGKVAWCRRCGENGSSVAGLRLFDDVPEAELTLSGLVNEGLRQGGAAKQDTPHPLSRDWAGKGLNVSPLSSIL
jgi:hypothetical protein